MRLLQSFYSFAMTIENISQGKNSVGKIIIKKNKTIQPMKTILSLAAFYLIFLVILTLFQRKFIYFPYKLDKEFEYP
ncbi:MAG: hypothetical protein R3339_08190, partial [Thermodesulfobacteriota bacterium]|nr:hypothetical protein [Thermodesulfobacteriota bacterium]